jgi:hypothetical protein
MCILNALRRVQTLNNSAATWFHELRFLLFQPAMSLFTAYVITAIEITSKDYIRNQNAPSIPFGKEGPLPKT